ncbi:MAG: hypothetical protein ABEJ83_02275 [Candidatus Nanohaloarchaea archaeon]
MGRGGIGFNIGVELDQKLDLRPFDEYDRNIEALEQLLNGEYEVVGETTEDMHPRVFHESFKHSYRTEAPAKVDSEALDMMQDILEENSEEEHFLLSDKLFDLGYNSRFYGPRNLSDIHDNPAKDYGEEMVPDFDSPFFLNNPYKDGKRKREADAHYA